MPNKLKLLTPAQLEHAARLMVEVNGFNPDEIVRGEPRWKPVANVVQGTFLMNSAIQSAQEAHPNE